MFNQEAEPDKQILNSSGISACVAGMETQIKTRFVQELQHSVNVYVLQNW